MDYDLLAAFDHPGVDPLAQQQAAQLLSPQSMIQPPTFTGGAGLAEGRPQTNVGGGYYAADPFTSYQQASGPSNNEIAMAAWEAARQQQMGPQNAAPSLYEDSSYNQPFIPYAATDRSVTIPPSIIQGQAARIAQRAGLPRELFQLGQNVLPMPGELARPFYDSPMDTRPLAYEGGGNVYSQPVTMKDLSQNDYASYVPIHENLHVFEEYLTDEEQNTLNFIMTMFPPPAGIPSEHHPPAVGGIATGLTAYMDNWLGPWGTPGMTGQRPPTPPPAIMEFIRTMAPIIQRRQRSGAIPRGLRQ